MQIFKVGGCVRDKLLGRVPTDIDYVVVGSSIKEMLDAGYTRVGKDFPVFLHPTTHDEYALARTEKKSGTGYNGFITAFTPDVTLVEDLMRRDLTINSIAEDSAGNLIDPYNGLADIKNKVIRHTSAAFVDDPVRVLRVARFYSRYANIGFTVADETKLLMQQIANSGELDTLTSERVLAEIYKALGTDHPEKFFEILHETGALACVLPELDALWGIPQPVQHHPEIDTGVHTMMVLQQAVKESDDVAVRLAALFHDLGKGVTPVDKWPSHHDHEELGIAVIAKVVDRLRIPKEHASLCTLASKVHLNVHRLAELTPKVIVRVMQEIDIYRKPHRIIQLATICKCDARGRTGLEDRDYPSYDRFIELATALRTIDISDLITLKMEPLQFKEAIHVRRINTVKSIKSSWSRSIA